MSTSSKKILAIFGATGYQGGAIANYFLSLPNSPYHIRALTRNPKAPKAQALVSAGAEVVAADLDSPASITSAVQGAHAVYLVTDFWTQPPSQERELAQAKSALSILSKLPTLEHLIWSALPSVKDATGGKYDGVLHFDGKAEITKFIQAEYPQLWAKTTVLWIAVYYQVWQQFGGLLGPKKMDFGGGEVFALMGTPNESTVIPTVDVTDTGKVVGVILSKGKELMTRTVSLIGDDTNSLGENLKLWGKHVGRPVAFQQVTVEQSEQGLRALGFPDFLVKDMTHNMLAFKEFEGKIYKAEGVVYADEILPKGEKLKTWEEFVKTENWDGFLNA